jgi:hypothetical protein
MRVTDAAKLTLYAILLRILLRRLLSVWSKLSFPSLTCQIRCVR